MFPLCACQATGLRVHAAAGHYSMDTNIDNHHQRRHYHHRHHKIALLPMLFGLQPLPRSTQQAPATWDRFGRPCFRLGIMKRQRAVLQTKVGERDPPPAKRRREVVCACRCSSGGRFISLDSTHTPPAEQMVPCACNKCSDHTGKHQRCQVKVWVLSSFLTGGLCGECCDDESPTALSLVRNMSALLAQLPQPPQERAAGANSNKDGLCGQRSSI